VVRFCSAEIEKDERIEKSKLTGSAVDHSLYNSFVGSTSINRIPELRDTSQPFSHDASILLKERRTHSRFSWKGDIFEPIEQLILLSKCSVDMLRRVGVGIDQAAAREVRESAGDLTERCRLKELLLQF